MPDYNDDLRLAHVLADAADAATMERFKAIDLKVETKPDLTPVTEADKAAEELIRGQLARARPRDAVLGEEYGSEGGGARRWIVDPIDGTKNYVRGVPVWATLISLAVRGEGGDEVVVGVVSAPALGRRWWAAKGGGAYTGRSLASATRLQVSRVGRLEDASFAYSSLHGWEEAGRLEGFLRLTRTCWRTRGYGDFWPYMMVAEGSVDICAEPELSVWDMAANDVIVREAGGRFTSLEGVSGPFGADAAASNGLLHEELLGYLGRA
ncbi:putative monophosphatase [Actinacidiphila reveromycinica]|uniref:Histidinol-phosphatase n=1 Tax=Actinacidiphila reveromycinica TaxID=659352 RepID=A0A7U3UWD7_9ACTN|nr:histidinol-phosphatase [Streptomyces sp. SN-593]BBA99971.1 putative monophosphatase [Streptomyces sp. SN-593]